MRIWNQFLCLMLLLSGNRPYFSQNSRRGIIDWVWLLTFGGLLPDGKKAFFTWSADSTPFANAFRTFLHYLISISYSCHAFLFFVCNTFTFWKRFQTFISVLWQIVDTENQFAMQPAKSQLQPENALFAIVCNRHRSLLLLWQIIIFIAMKCGNCPSRKVGFEY